MSDDAIQYWKAWKGTFGEESKHFLCSWHVDKSWRNALTRHVADNSARAEVYAKLRVLMPFNHGATISHISGLKPSTVC